MVVKIRPTGSSRDAFVALPVAPASSAPCHECPTGGRRTERIREDLRERLALEIKVGARIAHRGGHTGVAEQLTDGRELDVGLEQVDGGRVTKRVRMNAPALGRGPILRQVLAQEIAIPNAQVEDLLDARSVLNISANSA